MDAEIERHLSDMDKSILAEFEFVVSSSGDRFVVRDPQNKKLGGKGRLEGGNITSLLLTAKRERAALPKEKTPKAKRVAAPKVPKDKPATTPAEPKEAATRPSEQPATAPVAEPVRTAKPRAKRQRDMSAMNAVYDAVLMGMEPIDCYAKLSAKGIHFVSDKSVYTHSAIAKRVRDRALELGWIRPEEDENEIAP